MGIDEILEAFGSGKVNAPVGVETCFVVMVTEDGSVKAAGRVANKHADDIAYWLMALKRGGANAENTKADQVAQQDG